MRQSGSALDTALMARTVDLLTAHKLSIAEMVEMMKEEMEIVQEMENTEDRDSELYVDRLEHVLGLKCEAIEVLRKELHFFQAFRSGGNRK